MSKKKRSRPRTRAEPVAGAQTVSKGTAWLCSPEAYETLCCSGYADLAHNPEICAAVDTIARLVGSMTIYLMENTPAGDVRIRNQLSRVVDIEPNRYMTRSALIQWIVKTMLLDGDGNAVVLPKTRNGLLDELIPAPAAGVSYLPDPSGWGYRVRIGSKEYDPADVLHFTVNPSAQHPWLGTGYRVALKDVAHNLKQAAATEKGFMESKWKPSLIVKVDAMTEEFSSPEGRKKLLQSYIQNSEAGEPWLIPADQFSVHDVRPLSLADLALPEVVQLDKRTVAAVLGIPAFVLGVGEFNRDAWNNFISARIMPLAQTIEQVLTRGLLYKPEWYWHFNARSLYAYDLKDLATIADDQYVRGIMDGNEVRDWLNLSPREGLNDLIILENYIPRGMIGDQNKLNGGE